MRTETPEQIPWAALTKVVYQSGVSIELEQGTVKANIWNKDFEWSGSVDSKEAIKEYLTLNAALTRDIQDHFEIEGSGEFKENVKSWLKTGFPVNLLPREGPKEWRPQPKKRERRPTSYKIVGEYGIGNTYNEDPYYWWGEKFEYANFETDEAEGAVILWEGHRKPEVYLGNQFDDFMSSQHEGDPSSYENFLRFNSRLENGLMWAWEKLGVFDEPSKKIVRLKDGMTLGVLKAIENDPSILLPESVEKILLKFDEFPAQIQKAVQWLMNNHRRELEKALGQRLIWGDLYRE